MSGQHTNQPFGSLPFAPPTQRIGSRWPRASCARRPSRRPCKRETGANLLGTHARRIGKIGVIRRFRVVADQQNLRHHPFRGSAGGTTTELLRSSCSRAGSVGFSRPSGQFRFDTTRYYRKIMRQEYTVGLNLQTSGPDPDPILDLFYGCGSSLNWGGYCNHDVDKLIEQQSTEGGPARRKQILWQIERKIGRGGRAADHLLRRRRHLYAALRQGPDRDGQQHLQRGAGKTYGLTNRPS
jgi:hypothetical protein